MFLLYFALWIIFNGAITPEICLFGLGVAAVMFAFTCKFMDYSVAKEQQVIRRFFPLIRYIFVLVKEIVKANFTVIHMILSEKEEPEPALVHFTADMQTPTGRALLANAITLTPGTITVTLEDADYVVHCLDEGLAVGMDHSVFVELLEALEQPAQGKGGRKYGQ